MELWAVPFQMETCLGMAWVIYISGPSQSTWGQVLSSAKRSRDEMNASLYCQFPLGILFQESFSVKLPTPFHSTHLTH